MTEGIQVNLEQTYTYLMEEAFARAGRQVQVLNFSASGYSPIQELLVLRREGPRYGIDTVILPLFLDNDVAGCHPDLTVSTAGPPFVAVEGDRLRFDFRGPRKSYSHYHREPIYSLRRWSHAYRFVSDVRMKLSEPRRARGASGVPPRFELYASPPSAPWEDAWRTMERILLEFSAEARRQRARFVILSIPAGHVVSPGAWEEILASYPLMKERRWDLEGPERRLETFARSHDLELVPSLQQFREASGGPLFFGNRGHLTPQGHVVLADLLWAFLKSGSSPI